uniref:Uncharacterized protein n=1 Tax=Rhizophora mucronata TaxID=61149 RepID=A0A2P2JVX0_RHIMU
MFLCFFFWVHFGGFSVGLHGIFRWFLRKKLFGFFTDWRVLPGILCGSGRRI